MMKKGHMTESHHFVLSVWGCWCLKILEVALSGKWFIITHQPGKWLKKVKSEAENVTAVQPVSGREPGSPLTFVSRKHQDLIAVKETWAAQCAKARHAGLPVAADSSSASLQRSACDDGAANMQVPPFVLPAVELELKNTEILGYVFWVFLSVAVIWVVL